MPGEYIPPSLKARRARRFQSKRRYFKRDHYRGKWYRTERDYAYVRVQTSTITGFGRAYKRRSKEEFV